MITFDNEQFSRTHFSSTPFLAFLMGDKSSVCTGGGYGGLGNFQERQFSHTRTRNVDTMLLCASFLFLNGRFESSSSRADPRKTSNKCKFMDKKIFPLVFAKDSASFRRKLVSSPKGLRCKQGIALRRM
ncbi:MAG: hypothetical protein HDR36_09590 [Treponema sp.]|nr:hypothetical protein [Treponema sp.]